MKKLVYLFACAFLAFALYLNFVHKDEPDAINSPSKTLSPTTGQSTKTTTNEARPLSQNLGGQ